MLLLCGTHDFFVYSLVLDPTEKTLKVTHTLRLREHPSWLTRHPTHRDIVYTTSHVDRKLYALRITDSSTGKLEVVNEAESGGVGPTHILVLPDESAIVVAQYGQEDTGRLALMPINKDGTFASICPLHVYAPSYPGPQAPDHPRFEAPHVHGVYAHPITGDVYAPDLGSNCVLRMKASTKEGFKQLGTVGPFEQHDGPRHSQIHPSGRFIYTLTEVGNALVVHELHDDGTCTHRHRFTVLPECDRNNLKMNATEILLCPPLMPQGPSLLICANRFSDNPEGDALALFSVSSDGSQVTRTEVRWLHGAGNHLRGLHVDESGKYVSVNARDKGGVTIYERVGAEGLELQEVARAHDVPNTVVSIWI